MIITYFIVCLAGTAAGAACYMLYKGCTLFVAGYPLSVFSVSFFIQGLQLLFPISLIVMPAFLSLYSVRHPGSRRAAFITYAVLGLFSWGVAMRGAMIWLRAYSVPACTKSTPLSTGYFRNLGGSVWYFTDVSGLDEGHSRVSGLRISLGGEQGPAAEPVSGKEIERADEEFKEPVVSGVLALPPLLVYVLQIFDTLRLVAFNAQFGTWAGWLCFLSIGPALCAVYGFVRMSSWRLLNCFFILVAFSGVLVANKEYYVSPLFNTAEVVVNGWLAKTVHVQIPFICLLNIAVTCICLAVGIIAAPRWHNNQEAV